MKIAVVTDDHRTISAHFGRAAYYEIFTIDNGKVIEQHAVEKSHHPHENAGEPRHAGNHHDHDHNAMLDPILDCTVLITRGMGTGAYNALKGRSIEPIITDIEEILSAVNACLDGTIINRLEHLH